MTELRTEAIPLVDGSTLRLTVAEPVSSTRGGIVVLHEARGVTDAVRGLVHGLAGEGWLTVAPHLYHRDGADELDGDDGQVQQQVDRLDGEQVMADTDTAFDWLAEHDISTDRMGVIGFDLGGTVALLVAAERTLGAAVTVEGEGITEARSAGAAVVARRGPRHHLPVAGHLRRAGRRRAPGDQAAARRGRVLGGGHRRGGLPAPADTASTTTRTPRPTPGSARSTGSTPTCADRSDRGVVYSVGSRVYPDDRWRPRGPGRLRLVWSMAPHC